MRYTIGIDYGTNSVRCLVSDVAAGREIASCVYNYPSGKNGILLDPNQHLLARQNPADYLDALLVCVKGALKSAKETLDCFEPHNVIGIGVDTTGSTPIPVDKHCQPIGLQNAFSGNLNAQAWLWKDHTALAEAREITSLAKKMRPECLTICGGAYSSEWFFSKILHCLRVDRKVFDAAYTWLECCDYIPAVLCGINDSDQVVRGRCAAGHKAMFSDRWQGYPDGEFLEALDPAMKRLKATLPDHTATIDMPAGKLCKTWADKLGLREGINVAAGALDAHMGAVGSGVGKGRLVKIIGTSACDILVGEKTGQHLDIPGLCGIVDGSVLPGYWGIEAGQAAVGDIFNWFVEVIGGSNGVFSHSTLTSEACRIAPGQSGLLALDWNNGNRTVLADQHLTGLLIGQTLQTTPAEVYRALIESTAFGARKIIEHLEQHAIQIDEVIACGGIAEKNAFLMQVYADVTGKKIKTAGSSQACALGSAIAAAVAAGEYANIEQAQATMSSRPKAVYEPAADRMHTYAKLYGIYSMLHDSFGKKNSQQDLYCVMKELLAIKEKASLLCKSGE